MYQLKNFKYFSNNLTLNKNKYRGKDQIYLCGGTYLKKFVFQFTETIYAYLCGLH